LVLGCLIVAVYYGLLGILLHYHIRWWTMPYRYPSFVEACGLAETLILILGVISIHLVLGGTSLSMLFVGTTEFLATALNLNSVDTHRTRKSFTKFFGGTLLFFVFVCIWVLPIVGYVDE